MLQSNNNNKQQQHQPGVQDCHLQQMLYYACMYWEGKQIPTRNWLQLYIIYSIPFKRQHHIWPACTVEFDWESWRESLDLALITTPAFSSSGSEVEKKHTKNEYFIFDTESDESTCSVYNSLFNAWVITSPHTRRIWYLRVGHLLLAIISKF